MADTSTTFKKYNVLDENGLDVLLTSIFSIIEANYVRRTETTTLANAVFENVTFDVNSNGELIVTT